MSDELSYFEDAHGLKFYYAGEVDDRIQSLTARNQELYGKLQEIVTNDDNGSPSTCDHCFTGEYLDELKAILAQEVSENE